MNKSERDVYYTEIFAIALAAGVRAGQTVTPQVPQDIPPKNYGPAGFAWVTVYPGHSSFARWLKLHGHAVKGHKGGVTIHVSEYGDNWLRKEAHARAMATVFIDNGLKAIAYSKVD